MRSANYQIRIAAAALMLTAGAALCAATATPAEVAIVANRTVPADSLSQRELLDIYSGEIRQWDNGDPIVPHDMMEEGEVRETFYEYLGRKSSRLKSIWVKNLLMGEGSPPEPAGTEEELLTKVANTPGAIGFVRRELAGDSVKVLALISDANHSK